jgi:hypothetical protein
MVRAIINVVQLVVNAVRAVKMSQLAHAVASPNVLMASGFVQTNIQNVIQRQIFVNA